MTMASITRAFGIPMLCLSTGMQLLALLIVLCDLSFTGRVNFAAVFSYATAQPIAAPAFMIGCGLTYAARHRRLIKSLYLIYLGSHGLILLCTFVFPGRFAP